MCADCCVVPSPSSLSFSLSFSLSLSFFLCVSRSVALSLHLSIHLNRFPLKEEEKEDEEDAKEVTIPTHWDKLDPKSMKVRRVVLQQELAYLQASL